MHVAHHGQTAAVPDAVGDVEHRQAELARAADGLAASAVWRLPWQVARTAARFLAPGDGRALARSQRSPAVRR